MMLESDPSTNPAGEVALLSAAPTDAIGDAPPAASVGQAATRGLVWMTAASLIAKVVGFVQLIVLAWFLRVDDFGLLTMATTVVAFVSIPLRFALEEILIQRYRRFHLWRGPAFWLSLATGAGTMGLLLIAAPLGAWFYGSWRVSALMVVFAAASPVGAAMAVPYAKLSAELRFGTLAAMSIAQILTQAIVSLPMAALGCGAMSVAVAGLAAAAANTAGHWWQARVGPVGGPRVRCWRYFLRDTGMIQGSRLATAVASNADFITVGRLGGAGPLGIYSYAYNQSLQAMRLVAANAAAVLFPSLSSFGDDAARKYAAFLRGMRLVMPLLVPSCLLQAALAQPAFHLLFKPAYWPGVPLFQILSFGTIGVGAVTLCHSFLLSMRRNDLSFANSAGSAACFCALAPLGWHLGRTPGVAVGVTATGALSLAFAHWLAARAVAGAVARPGVAAARLYGMPLLLGALSCAPSWWLFGRALPPDAGRWDAGGRLLAGGATFAVLFPPLLFALSRSTFDEIVRRTPVLRDRFA